MHEASGNAERKGSPRSPKEKKRGVSYGEYLHLDRLLSCQKPLSTLGGKQEGAHEEPLFIHIHQSYEIWFKHILHELSSIQKIFSTQKANVPESDILLVASRLERITVIQKLLVDQLSILETMTPQDFLAFRDYLFHLVWETPRPTTLCILSPV